MLFKDLGGFKGLNGRLGDLETRTEPLGLSVGVDVLYYGGVLLNIIERPRTVCMRDGRVFISTDMIKDEAYLGVLPSILEKAEEIFGDERFSELYAKVIES